MNMCLIIKQYKSNCEIIDNCKNYIIDVLKIGQWIQKVIQFL